MDVVARLCVDVSLSANGLHAEGGTAIAGALPGLSSLATLEYVRIEGDVWCVSNAMEPCHGRCKCSDGVHVCCAALRVYGVCALSGACGVWCVV